MSRCTPTKCVTRLSRLRSATTVLDVGKVLPSLRRWISVPRQIPFSRTSVPTWSTIRSKPRSSSCGRVIVRSLVTRVAERPDARVVRVLECAVSRA